MATVRKIFRENLGKYLKRNSITEHQKYEVEKMLNCGRNSCNSRICSSCGKRYADQWSGWLKNYLLPIPHRHVVLTVPVSLRNTLRNWSKLRILMEASSSF